MIVIPDPLFPYTENQRLFDTISHYDKDDSMIVEEYKNLIRKRFMDKKLSINENDLNEIIAGFNVFYYTRDIDGSSINYIIEDEDNDKTCILTFLFYLYFISHNKEIGRFNLTDKKVNELAKNDYNGVGEDDEIYQKYPPWCNPVEPLINEEMIAKEQSAKKKSPEKEIIFGVNHFIPRIGRRK